MKTPLYNFHKNKGRITNYAGFDMPLWYKGAIIEHLSVRESLGIFDVSHMGRIVIAGKEASKYLEYILTNLVSDMKMFKARHAFMCNSNGGIVDDVMVLRLEENKFLLIVNAINRVKDVTWLNNNQSKFKVVINDVTSKVPMIALQGPKALKLIQKISDNDIYAVKRMSGRFVTITNTEFFVTRTGYTGEDGFELFFLKNDVDDQKCVSIWQLLLNEGSSLSIEPCGLAARDTLRIEAGFCLYGNELSKKVTPLEADMDFGVKLNNHKFIGREALIEQSDKGLERIRVGFELFERGIPRTGMNVVKYGKKIGEVTSGTYSPLLKKGIGMAYVHPEEVLIGSDVTIDIRGKQVKAKIVEMPFYNEDLYGWRRSMK